MYVYRKFRGKGSQLHDMDRITIQLITMSAISIISKFEGKYCYFGFGLAKTEG